MSGLGWIPGRAVGGGSDVLSVPRTPGNGQVGPLAGVRWVHRWPVLTVKRMFTYNYRIFDRYDRPVVSLAVLADPHPGWRPDGYSSQTTTPLPRARWPS